jgi:uncharacterized protein YaiL (DUF2058 family)
MSLRDQLLAAGLVSQKQVREAERQQQHQQREQTKHKRRPPAHAGQAAKTPGHGTPATAGGSASGGKPSATNPAVAHGAGGAAPLSPSASAALRHASAQSAKVARDLALNKKQQEKAEQKARAAQIKQLIEQNRVPRGDSDERYNFLDGGRVKFIGVNAEIRRRLMAGELVIVRHDRIHEVVPAATAERIRERDARAVITAAPSPTATAVEGPPVDDAYKDFAVPDDLMW